MWAVQLASLVQVVVSLMEHFQQDRRQSLSRWNKAQFDKCRLDFGLSLKSQAQFDGCRGRLLAVWTVHDLTKFITAAKLEQPFTLDLIPYISKEKGLFDCEEYISTLEKMIEGERLAPTEIFECLQSEGYSLREASEDFDSTSVWPEPFDDFKEYYATQPTDIPIASNPEVGLGLESQTSVSEALEKVEIGEI
jgi:hypothetical protein